MPTISSERKLSRLSRFQRAHRRVREETSLAHRRTIAWRAFTIVALITSIISAAFIIYTYQNSSRLIEERLGSGYLTSRAGIYAAPRVLRAGQNFTREHLIEILRRAGYIEGQASSDVWSGAFNVRAEDAIEIRPRRNSATGSVTTEHIQTISPEVVEITFNRQGRIKAINGDGMALDSFTLEPEALTNDASVKAGTRRALAYADIPPVLLHAILAIEDRRFFEHRGVDPTGIGRALLSWTKTSDETQRQGGSTITQQLVKNTYLTPERTLRRKFNEAILAAALERRLSKQDIFALYCNEIYLGQRGTIAVRGVEQAARVYFGKELKDLSLSEAATIAGMIQSPARYAPERHPEQAQARRNLVLSAMLRDGTITSEEARAASSEPVCVAATATADEATAPYFVDYVNRAVEAQLQARSDVDERSLRVFTTIDLDLQQLAEHAVRDQLAQLAKAYPKRGTPQAALIALDPQTGEVLAMVGGGNGYGESQLNRVTDAERQPGSVFKPFVYAAALESGISPVTLIKDAPRTFTYDQHATYRPSNYGGGYSMRDVTMRTGLVRSLNVVTVDLALRTGLNRVATLAGNFGLPKPEAYPSLALGTTEATPLEIASAYSAFANAGTRTRPRAVARAFDANGANLILDQSPESQQVIRPSTAYMITDMLADVINEGTARAARGMFKGTAIAGKTGTSRDGWFAGYTPNLVCVVWIGFDDNEQLGLTGAASALPVWTEFMKGAISLRPELGGAAFVRPEGIMTVEIDPETGLLATSSCPQRQRIALTPALAPASECYTHQPPLTLLASTDAPNLTEEETSLEDVPSHAPSTDARRTAHAPRRDVLIDDESGTLPSRATRAEVSGGGRMTLTNELQISPSSRTRNR